MGKIDAARIRAEIREHRRHLKVYVLERDGAMCFLGQFCGNAATDLHEIRPKRNDYPPRKQIEYVFTPDNCVLLCQECHMIFGQTRLGTYMFKHLLWLKYGRNGGETRYRRPDVST